MDTNLSPDDLDAIHGIDKKLDVLTERLANFIKNQEELESELSTLTDRITDLERFKYKALGIVSGVVFVSQWIGPVVQKLFEGQ